MAFDTVIDSFPENMAFDAADSMASSSPTAFAPERLGNRFECYPSEKEMQSSGVLEEYPVAFIRPDILHSLASRVGPSIQLS